MTARLHPAQSTADNPPDWPKGVFPISQDGLAHLGVGNDGPLYWDGKPVVVRKTFSLTLAQKVGAFIVGASALVAATMRRTFAMW